MADKKGIEKLDEKLIGAKIVSKQYKADLPLVHRKMNSIIKKTGRVLSDAVFETGNAALRKWLALLSKQGATQAKLTAYLRCGLAHLTYDYVESQYKKIGPDDLISRTLVSMKNRKFHNCFFKPGQEPTAAPAAKKGSSAKKKIEPVLKTLAYKKKVAKKAPKKASSKKPASAKKKAVVKKPAKAAAKKGAVKKAAVRKAGAKKPVARKATPKKTVKKPAAKKKAVLKTLAYRKAPAKKPAGKSASAKGPKKAKKTNIVKAISRKAEALKKKVTKAVKGGTKSAAKKPVSKKPSKASKVKVYSYNDRLTHLVK